MATANFPADSIDAIQENYVCKRCNRVATVLREKFLQCTYCSSKSLVTGSEKKVFLKLTFKTTKPVTLSMYDKAYLKFCSLLNLNPSDLDETQVRMLTVSNIFAEYCTTTNAITDIKSA